MSSSDEIKIKSQKADQVYSNAMNKLKDIRKMQREVLDHLVSETNDNKILKIKKDIESL